MRAQIAYLRSQPPHECLVAAQGIKEAAEQAATQEGMDDERSRLQWLAEFATLRGDGDGAAGVQNDVGEVD